MMRFRRLQFEQLERRELLTADWPTGIGTTDVLIDAGAGLSHYVKPYALDTYGIEHIDLRTSSGAKTRAAIIGGSGDANGWMRYPDGQWAVRAVYIHGGSATSHGKALGDAGQEVFREFFENGGGIAGSCAGLWFLRTGRNYAEIWDGTVKNSGRSGYQTVSFAGDEGPFVEYLDRFGVPDVVKSIRHIGGPRVGESWDNPKGTVFYGEIIGGVAKGTNYVMTYETDTSGPALGFPGHPEYYDTGDRMNLYAAGISYVVERSRIEPRIVGDLTAGTTASIVGAGQYHRYSMTVPPGLAAITLSTDALDGTEIFVTHDGVAYQGGADYSGDTVTIAAPAAGEWEVSLLGTHDTANGAPYAVTLGAYRDDPIRWTQPEGEQMSNAELRQMLARATGLRVTYRNTPLVSAVCDDVSLLVAEVIFLQKQRDESRAIADEALTELTDEELTT